MAAISHVGRKLAHKRARKIRTVALLPVGPASGALAALMQTFREEAACMTPEQIAAEDAAYAKLTKNLTFSTPSSGLNIFEAFVTLREANDKVG